MGLSKRIRVGNTAAQVVPAETSAYQTYRRLIDPAILRAVRQRVWLEGMQKQLSQTAAALRENPASVLTPFQKTLKQPSYFAMGETGNWVVLLGPRSAITPAAPKTAALTVPSFPPRVFDFAVPQPAPWQNVLSVCRGLLSSFHQWLMDPVIDTRT
jgi:hypothetical protein